MDDDWIRIPLERRAELTFLCSDEGTFVLQDGEANPVTLIRWVAGGLERGPVGEVSTGGAPVFGFKPLY